MGLLKMFMTALIFAFSIGVTIQFVIYSWRAQMLKVVHIVASQQAESDSFLKDKGFCDIAAYQELCPSLDKNSNQGLGPVRLYYSFLKLLGTGEWVKNEINLCSQYAAAVMLQKLQHNQTLAAEVRSF
jgi:hypothetical protein